MYSSINVLLQLDSVAFLGNTKKMNASKCTA